MSRKKEIMLAFEEAYNRAKKLLSGRRLEWLESVYSDVVENAKVTSFEGIPEEMLEGLLDPNAHMKMFWTTTDSLESFRAYGIQKKSLDLVESLATDKKDANAMYELLMAYLQTLSNEEVIEQEELLTTVKLLQERLHEVLHNQTGR